MRRTPLNLATAQTGPALSNIEQVAFYVSAGVVIPAVSWSAIRGIPLDTSANLLWLSQILLANLAAWFVIAKLRSYSRARILSYVLPVNSIAFGAVISANAFLRTSIPWSLLLICAASSLAISYLVTARIRHANPKMRHFVVPGGNVGRLLKQAGFLGLGSPRELDDLIERKLISGSVVADLHHEQGDEWARLLAKAALRGVPVYHYRLIEEAITGEVRISHLRENELGSLIPNIPYRLAKRVIDVASVIALAPFLLPALSLIALLIKFDGRGPILFYQKRLGHRGEYFKMVKFRTMRERSVEDSDDARRLDAVTRDGDDRITRVGRFLRKTRLDELPQAWNILKGEMSWIGPRPEASELANWYEDQIPFYAYRHIVRPGITGWAQVNQGHVADVDEVRAKLRFDFYYIKNLSLWLDLLIALKTIRVVLGGIGAK